MEGGIEIKSSASKMIDKNWIISDTILNRFVKSSYWRNVNDYHSLKIRTGVFLFVDIFYQVQYIGKADEGRMVIEIAEAIRAGKLNGASLIKVLYTSSTEKAQLLERELIKKYHPTNNLE